MNVRQDYREIAILRHFVSGNNSVCTNRGNDQHLRLSCQLFRFMDLKNDKYEAQTR